jgi:hypothetical protein
MVDWRRAEGTDSLVIRRGRRRDDGGPAADGEYHRDRSDRACAAVHENRVGLGDVEGLDEVVCRDSGEEQPCCLVEVDGVGQCVHRRRGCDDGLGERSGHRVDDHTIACRRPGARRGLPDHPGAFVSDLQGQLRRVLSHDALDALHVERVDPRGADIDGHRADRRGRQFDIDDGEDFTGCAECCRNEFPSHAAHRRPRVSPST